MSFPHPSASLLPFDSHQCFQQLLQQGVVDMSSSNKYVNVEFRTNLDSLKAAVRKAGIVRKVNLDMSWEDVFLLQKIPVDERLSYNVSSRNGCIITSVKNTVGEHIRKFAIPLQLYPVTIELNVKKERVERVETVSSMPREFAMGHHLQLNNSAPGGSRGAVGGPVVVDTRPAHVILLETLLREQMHQLIADEGDEDEDSNSGNDSNYSSDGICDEREMEGGLPNPHCPYANNGDPPVVITWNLPPVRIPEGRLLAASVIETPKVDGVPFLNSTQIKMCAGMLVNRFGLETMLEKKFEFVNMMTDKPHLFRELRERSKFTCDLIMSLFSDDMFNPPPRQSQDFL